MTDKSGVISKRKITSARVECPTCGKNVRVKYGGIIANHGFRRKLNGTIDMRSACAASGTKYGAPVNRIIPCTKCGRPVTTAQEGFKPGEKALCPLCRTDGGGA